MDQSARRADASTGERPAEDCFEVPPGPDGVRAGRQYVRRRVIDGGARALVDDAALVAAELLANALQHGAAPVVVRAWAEPGRARIEVRDEGPRWPVVGPLSAGNMTGRGLTLVDAVSSGWGIHREATGGKTVWCELSTAAHETHGRALNVAALLPGEEEVAEGEQRYTVVLGDVPTGLLMDAKAHIDNLVREFSLAAAGGHEGVDVPEPLARLIETVVHGFADARAAIKRQALAAAQRHEPRTRLVLHLPLSAAAAGEAYLAALDEADTYSRAARLLTLETPPEHKLFRRWYVEAVIDQLRRVARSEPPAVIEPFESRLLAEVRALSAAQRVSDRAARLQRVTAALARARTPGDVASVVLSEAVGALGASGGGLLLVAPDGEHLAVPGALGYGEQLMGQLREERLDARLPAATALRTGSSVWLESQVERDAHFPELRGFEPSTVAMCAVPLILGDRSLGALRFSFDSVKLFDEDERAFVGALAAYTAQTLQRTELYQAERQASLELQRALLPQQLSTTPGWDVAAYYQPAGGQELGGDFYDVIPLPDGRIAALAGDVMGRGLHAAAAMAEIRSAIRAYVIDDPDPVSVFRRVDTFFARLDLDQLVTVVYFLVERGGDVVQVANAGHLPPLLVAQETAEVLPIDGGLPFGAGADERDVTVVHLPPGGAIVAITDGLVERRGEDIDVGVGRLVNATARATWSNAQALLDQIVQVESDERAEDDDVTVLVLRRD